MTRLFLLLGATSVTLLIVLILVTLTTNKCASSNSRGVPLYHKALFGQLLCSVVSLVVRRLNIIFVKWLVGGFSPKKNRDPPVIIM